MLWYLLICSLQYPGAGGNQLDCEIKSTFSKKEDCLLVGNNIIDMGRTVVNNFNRSTTQFRIKQHYVMARCTFVKGN